MVTFGELSMVIVDSVATPEDVILFLKREVPIQQMEETIFVPLPIPAKY